MKKRIGGRGCPRCGSHNTEGFKLAKLQCCITCGNQWKPCRDGCRGYRVDLSPSPRVFGCPDCGVPDKVAAWWPEAYRALALKLDGLKSGGLVQPES